MISKRYVTNKVLHPRGANKRLVKFDLGKFSKENNAKTGENCAMKWILPGIGRGNQSFYEKMISNSLSANSPKGTWLKQSCKN